MTPEELKQWLSSLTVPEDDEMPCYYFTTSDPYLKHESLDPNKVVRGISSSSGTVKELSHCFSSSGVISIAFFCSLIVKILSLG